MAVRKWACANCRYRFESEADVEACPRCTSRRVSAVAEERPAEAPPAATPAGAPGAARTPRSFKFYEPRIYGETKDAWKSFHAAEVKQCTKCGGTEFRLDWKHKEKTCIKCGDIYPLPRRVQ